MGFFLNVGTSLFCFFRFSRSLKAIKRAMSKVFSVINISKEIFVIKLRLHEGRRSPVIIWLCPCSSSICIGEISQNFHN